MVVASLVAEWYYDGWRPDNTKPFIIWWQQDNYNDTEVFCNYTARLVTELKNRACMAVVDSIGVHYDGQIGARLPVELYTVRPGITTIEVYVGTMVTVALFEGRMFNQLDVPVDFGYASTANALVALWPSNYLATDDVKITLIGHLVATIPTPELNPSITPVSLEGYKWPLTRRV